MKKYKSLLALVLCLMMLFVLTGCTKSMTYSKADGKIYWAYYGKNADLIVIDPTDWSFTSTSFGADNGKTYEITAGDPAEKQIIVGPPFAFTGENIAEWANVY